MKTKLKYYIKSRYNPHFIKPYYVACGQLTKKEADQKENNSVLGLNIMLSYDTQSEYLAKIEELELQGFTVYK